MNKKILFYKIGGLSNVNKNLVEQLKTYFPNNELIEVDVAELVFSSKRVFYFNFIHFFKEYGLDFLTLNKSRWAIWDWYRVTSYIFKQYQKVIKQYAKAYDILFTLQTGSTFDGSLKGIPHFVYTDSTVLANLYYPNINIRSVFKSKAWMKLEPIVYKNATLNFTFSNIQVKSLIEQYNIDSEKVKCVFAGMNKTQINNNYVKTYLKKKILFAGFNWERKGGPLLIKAFEGVLKKHEDAELIIAGCNPDITIKNCKVLGRISLLELEKLYIEATVFCMPSQIEPFGIVYIDAMNFKCPVVASNIGAIPEFVLNNYNGFTFNPDDVEGFTQALVKLLDNPQLCMQFGENGYKLANENYTWERTGNLIYNYIKPSLEI